MIVKNGNRCETHLYTKYSGLYNPDKYQTMTFVVLKLSYLHTTDYEQHEKNSAWKPRS